MHKERYMSLSPTVALRAARVALAIALTAVVILAAAAYAGSQAVLPVEPDGGIGGDVVLPVEPDGGIGGDVVLPGAPDGGIGD
ncbi:MAG: hypothetical protein ABWY52_03675 [Candidatus Limnocylindrales bacterium]